MIEDFVNWLNNELNQRGWTNSELAKRSGMASSTISMIFARQSRPGWDFCAGVAKAFGEPPERVFRLAGLLPPEPEPGIKEDQLIAVYRQLQPLQQQFLIEASKGLRGVVAAAREPAPLPEIPAVPGDEHIMELFKMLDPVRQHQVYDFARWVLVQQEFPLNSSRQLDKQRQAEIKRAFEAFDLYLTVEEADPLAIERVIGRLQSMLPKKD